jgi:hypothetical protein
MGLIRKAMSVSTLGGVKYTSRREAETKAHIANARLANAQAQQAAGDPVGDRWEPITAAIEAGEASWSDLPRLQKMSMPIGYIVRCKAADRRRGAGDRA